MLEPSTQTKIVTANLTAEKLSSLPVRTITREDLNATLPQGVEKIGAEAMLAQQREIDPGVVPEEFADFSSRYLFPDIVLSDNDVPDVSYLRIVEFKNPENVIFPTSALAGGKINGVANNRFKQILITQLSEQKSERFQLTETNEHFTLNFFGDRAQILNIAGYLKNTIDNPWTINMIYLWEGLMRGTMLAENRTILELYCNNVLYRGYPTGLNITKIADGERIAQFQMQFIVWKRISVRAVQIAPIAPLDSLPSIGTGADSSDPNFVGPDPPTGLPSVPEPVDPVVGSLVDFLTSDSSRVDPYGRSRI